MVMNTVAHRSHHSVSHGTVRFYRVRVIRWYQTWWGPSSKARHRVRWSTAALDVQYTA